MTPRAPSASTATRLPGRRPVAASEARANRGEDLGAAVEPAAEAVLTEEAPLRLLKRLPLR